MCRNRKRQSRGGFIGRGGMESSVRWGSRPTQRREFMDWERVDILVKNEGWEGMIV